MADKKLNITADLKVKTTEAERVLQKLSKEGVKISQILKGLDLTTQGGRAGFAKSLTVASREMLKLRGTTQDTAKVMEYVYGRTLERQTKRLDEYTRRIEKLNKSFKLHTYNQDFYASVGNSKMAGLAQRRANGAADKIVIAEAARQAIQASINELRGSQGPSGPRPFDWAAMQQAMGFSRMMAGGIGGMAGVYQSYKTVGAQNLGHIRDFERHLLGRMAGGDFSDLYFATRKMTTGNNVLSHAKDQYGGTGAGRLETSANAVGGLLDVGLGVMQMKGKGGFSAGTSDLGEPLTTRDISNVTHGASRAINGITGASTSLVNRALGGPEVMEVQSMMAGLEAHKLQDPLTQMALQWTAGTAGMRVGAAKALQGRHMGAWGVGQGFGLDMGESFGAAQQLARQFGVDATMGRGGGTTTRTDVRMVEGSGIWLTPQDWAKQNYSRDASNSMALAGMKREELIKQGYEKFDEIGGNTLFRKQITEGGGGGDGLLRSVLGLERKGMDRGVAGTALGTMMMATGGNLNAANRQLEDVMTKAFGRGITDARLGEEIVRATGESAFSAGGRVGNMAAFGMMLSGGLGSGNTIRDVQANLGGVKAFDSLIKGNSYFSAVQLEAAKRTLGAGATGTQMLAIQRATMADLVGGSEQLDLAKVSDKQRRAILGQTANSLMGTYLTNSQDPATAQLRAALGANGGDVIKTFSSAGNNKKALMDQFALALSVNSGMSQEDATGLARVLSGADSKADVGSARRNYLNRGDNVAESTVRSQQAVLDEFFKKEREIQDEYLKALRAARPLAETIGANDPAFDAFQKFFTQFMEIMQKAMQDPRLRAQLVGGVTQKGQ